MHEDKGPIPEDITDADLRLALMTEPGKPYLDFLARHGLNIDDSPDAGFATYHFLRMLCPLIPTNDRVYSLKTLLMYHPECLGLAYSDEDTDTTPTSEPEASN